VDVVGVGVGVGVADVVGVGVGVGVGVADVVGVGVGVGVGVADVVGVGVGVGVGVVGVLPRVSSLTIVYLAVGVVIVGFGPGAIGFDKVTIMFSLPPINLSPKTSIVRVLDVSPGRNLIWPLTPVAPEVPPIFL
jgi:putative exporter of polyketide antibiotics